MKIIGHRGAAGLALENTVESIQAAIKAGVDAIEFDVRLTKDDKLVLSHDKHIGRVSEHHHRISKHNLRKLREVELHNGQPIATLSEAIKAAGNIPLVIEGKDDGWAQPLAEFLEKQNSLATPSVISFNHQELYIFHQLMPQIPTFALEHTEPLNVIRDASMYGFTGININFWILNPLTYLLARYHKLEVIVYTINKPWMARFVRIFYPNISITTDVPNQMQFLRPRKRRVKKNASHSRSH